MDATRRGRNGRTLRTVLLGLSSMIALSACGANFNSVFRSEELGDQPRLISIDAKQRVILTGRGKVETSTSTQQEGGAETRTHSVTERAMIYCAEPSPDVFTVFANAASASGSFGTSGEPSAVNAALQAAFSSNESGSSIPRTQTINLLRETMYRTCERYLNGALDDSTMAIQTIRDQRTMVATLAIEQLTSAASQYAVALGTTAAAGTGANLQDAILKIAEAKDAVAKAAVGIAKAEEELKKLDTPAPTCAALNKEKEEGKTSTDAGKLKKCTDAEAAVTQAKKVKTDAETHYATLAAALEKSSGGTTTSSGTTTPAFQQVANNAAADMSKVADKVAEIVKATFDQDEVLLLCVKEAGKDSSPAKAMCQQYLEAKINAARSEQELAIASNQKQINAFRAQAAFTNEKFEKLVDRIRHNGKLSSALLKTIVKSGVDGKKITPNEGKKLEAVMQNPEVDRQNLLKVFSGLSDTAVDYLSSTN